MELIKINLNQTVSKAQLEQIKEENQRWILFGVIILFIIGSLSWLFMINRKLNYIIEQRKNTIKEITTKTEDLTGKGQVNLSKVDINNLYKLENKRIYWSDKFLELSQMTPEDMAVTRFEFKGKNFSLEGIGNLLDGEKPLEVTSDFIKMIEKNETFNEDFKNLKVWKVAKKEHGKNNQEIIEFRIEAKLIK